MAEREADRAENHMIGGSNMASLINAFISSATSTSFIAATSKLFNNSFEGNVYTKIGHLCEEAIITAYDTALEDTETHDGVYIMESNQRHSFQQFRHRESDHFWQLVATPDLVLSDGTIVEIKTKVRPPKPGVKCVTNQHIMQLVYYMCFLDQPYGSLVYYTPEDGTIDLVTEYNISLDEHQRRFFKENLLYCGDVVANLYLGERIPNIVKNLASILYDYKRLAVERFSMVTPLIVHEVPMSLDSLLAQCPQK